MDMFSDFKGLILKLLVLINIFLLMINSKVLFHVQQTDVMKGGEVNVCVCGMWKSADDASHATKIQLLCCISSCVRPRLL